MVSTALGGVSIALSAAIAILVLSGPLGVIAQAVMDSECTTASQYYDISSLNCVDCPTGQEPRSDGHGCQCTSGYYSLYATDGTFTCVACGTGNATASDRSTCLPCAGTATLSGGECVCPAGSVLVDTNSQGQLLSSITCEACPSTHMTRASDPYYCERYPHPNMETNAPTLLTRGTTCECTPTATYVKVTPSLLDFGDEPCAVSTCIQKSSVDALTLSSVSEVSYHDLVGRPDLPTHTITTSETFARLFTWAAIACQDAADRQACQALGNLCVLQLYDASTAACQHYQALVDRTGQSNVNSVANWFVSLPWLYYSTDNVVGELESVAIEQVLAFEADLAGATTQLSLYAAAYAVNGTFLGLEPLVTQLQLCTGDDAERASYLRVGVSYRNACSLNVTALFSTDTPETKLYDVYLFDAAANVLVPVPVLLLNYRSGSTEVNRDAYDSASDQRATMQLTRRLFLYDTVSGKESTSAKPTVVRFASSISLTVSLQADAAVDGLIHPPLLTVEYSERHIDDVTDAVASGDITQPEVVFLAEYTMDTGAFWATMSIMFAMLLVVIVFATLVSMNFHGRVQQQQRSDQLMPVFLVTLARWASDLFFWLIFVAGCYWFVWFKWQSAVAVMLPPRGEIVQLTTMIAVTFAFKLVYTMHLIWRQSNVDIFFMDWEKSRGKLAPRGSEPAQSSPVSIWRTLFVANEWNELQTERIILMPWQLFCLGFLLIGLQLEYLATPQPDATNLSAAVTHPFLRFAVTTFFWLALALLQYGFREGVYSRFLGHYKTMFVDMLSLTNISVFVLDGNHGFYIHGRSPLAFSDTNMIELQDHMKKEDENIVAQRGLQARSDLQTFEMFVTNELREQYDHVFKFHLDNSGAGAGTGAGGAGPGGSGKGRGGGGRSTPSDKLLKAYGALNKFLTGFIEQSGNKHEYVIQDRTQLNRLFRNPPEMARQSKSIFLTDKEMLWTDLLMAGIEYHLIITYILFYALIDLAGNTMLSLTLTYLLDMLITHLRSNWGQANLARKTLVDQRFLI